MYIRTSNKYIRCTDAAVWTPEPTVGVIQLKYLTLALPILVPDNVPGVDVAVSYNAIGPKGVIAESLVPKSGWPNTVLML